MSFFNLNSEALFSQNPALRDAFSSYAPSELLEIIPTPTGRPSALYRGISVHSRRDPEKEARALIASEVPASVSVALFYGFGLGYLAEQFIRAFPDVPCLIVEPDPACFLKALYARDLRPVLNHPRTVFFLASDPSLIIQFMDTLELSAVHMVKLRSLFEKDLAYYERADALIRSFLAQRDVNRNTLRRFGRLWVRNLAQNIRLLALCPGIKTAEKLFSGIPALVCAGGPSLDAVLPHLRRLRASLLIIAVDTTLAALQKHGVDPDFIVIADPQYWNTRHLDAVKATTGFIVSESSTHPRIFRRLRAKVFFAGSVFPLGRHLESLVGEKGKLGAGGSVATTAWDCARYLGAEPIYLAGLDLGFPGRKTHFRGAFFEEAFHQRAHRFLPQETLSFTYLYEARPFAVPSNSGGLVLTDQRMAVFKFWFETQMRLHQETPSLNLSPNGVLIEGLPHIPIEKIESHPACRDLIESKKTALLSFFPSSSDANAPDKIALRGRALRTGLEDLIHDLEEYAALAGDGVRAATELHIRRAAQSDSAKSLSRLNTIDRRLTELAAKEVAGFLAGPLVQDIGRAGEKTTKPEEWLAYSLKLYRELEGSSRYHLAHLRQALRQLDDSPSPPPGAGLSGLNLL